MENVFNFFIEWNLLMGVKIYYVWVLFVIIGEKDIVYVYEWEVVLRVILGFCL